MSSINGSRVRFPESVFRIFKTGAASILATFDLTNLTASRTITLPDKAGTLAMTSDVSAAADVADNVFRISDNGDSTKKIAFEASGIDASTVRTITAPNRNHTLGGVELWATATKYIIGDVVGISYLGSVRFYRCTTAHTAAAAFATDVATKWTFLGAMQFEAALFAIMQTADPTKLVTFDPSAISASRAIAIPDKSGTLAMTSDITAGSLSDTQFLYRQAARNSNFDYIYGGTQTAPATDTELFAEMFAIKTAGGGTAPSITFSQDNSTLPDKKSTYVMKADVTAVGTANATTEGGWYFYVRDFEKFQSRAISFSIYMKAPANGELVDIVVYDGVTTTLKSRQTLTTGWVLYKYENISIASAATQIKITLRMAGGSGLTVASDTNFVPANTGAFYFGQIQVNDGTAAITYQPPIFKGGKNSFHQRTNWSANGATNTKIMIWDTLVASGGADLTYQNSSTNGDSWLVNSGGIYTISLCWEPTSINQLCELKVAASLNNNVNTNDAAIMMSSFSGSSIGALSWTGYIGAGKLIFFTNSSTTSTVQRRNHVTIAKIADLY